jgi:hypothetical protein
LRPQRPAALVESALVLRMDDFQKRIALLDLELFRHIESQSTRNDQSSLLALHLACRQAHREFTYLEIGSHLGGSMQALVVDPQCTRIVSIDPRPPLQPDERGENYYYAENSTQRMLDTLRQIPGADVQKIQTIDAGTDTIAPGVVQGRPDLCFIDGEHTDTAVVRDARFCLGLAAKDGCIAFHDANIIYRGLDQLVREVTQSGRPFRAYHLPDAVFVIELDECRFGECPQIRRLLDNNYQGYLWSLMANDEFRQTCRRPLFRLLRHIDAKIKACLS